MSKLPTILVISYNFIPIVNPRSLRCKYLVNYFANIGWKVIVLTISPSKHYPKYFEDSLKELSDEIEIHRVNPGIIYALKHRSPSQYSLDRWKRKDMMEIDRLRCRFREFIRKLYMATVDKVLLPDQTFEWVLSALKEAESILKRTNIDAMVSLAFPPTSHVIGYFLKKKHKEIVWIGDTGDPWSFGPLIQGIKSRFNRIIERHLIRKMNYHVVTNEAIKEMYGTLFPQIDPAKTVILTQGFSKEEIASIPYSIGNNFIIVYTGIFYDDIRNPIPFFEALKSFINEPSFKVVIAGNISYKYLSWIKENNLDEMVAFKGSINHSSSLALQKGATVLLNIGNVSPVQIPGKLSEYIGIQKPILHIKNCDGDFAAKVVKRLNRGVVVDNTPEEIRKGLKRLFSEYKKNELLSRYNLEVENDFEWNYIWGKLENYIKDGFNEIKK